MQTPVKLVVHIQVCIPFLISTRRLPYKHQCPASPSLNMAAAVPWISRQGLSYFTYRQQIHVLSHLDHLTCAFEQAAVPPSCHNGDLELLLDSGDSIHVHSILLEVQSDVFSEVFQTTAAPSPAATSKIYLPGITFEQALLLLHMLYQRDPAPWAAAANFNQLRQLASVCHALGCKRLLDLAEENLIQQLPAQMAEQQEMDLVAVYDEATQCGMQSLQAACIPHLVRLAAELKLPDAGSDKYAHELLLPVLVQAQPKSRQANAHRIKQASDLLQQIDSQLGDGSQASHSKRHRSLGDGPWAHVKALVVEAQKLLSAEE